MRIALTDSTQLTSSMHIQKFEHATLLVTVSNRKILVDPGSFLSGLDDWTDIDAVVITHEHPDHWTPRALETLRDANPAAPILSTKAVAEAAAAHDVRAVQAGETVMIGDVPLTFFGGRHEIIHSSIPVIDNVGVLIDQRLYYPGDSYAIPGVPVEVLAAPLGAPWLRIADAMNFVLAVAPRNAFGTHDMTLSNVGRTMHRERLAWATKQGGGTFFELDPGEGFSV